MLRRSPPQYRDDCSRPQDARGRAARAHHAGAPRKVRLGPIAFWIITGTLVVLAVWTIITATYFAFREDVLAKLLARHAEMQFAYEDRLAELRAQIDRFSSRQLIDQEAYEKKLEQILRRQAALESRAGALSGRGDIAGTIRQPSRAAQAASHARMCRSQRGTREPWSFRSIGAASHASAFLPKAQAASAA